MKHKREDIILYGQEIFRENGYHATGVSELLKACNIPKGTFYNYFKSKEQFAIASLQNYSSHIKKLINTYMGFTSQSAVKRLQRYFEQLIKLNQKEGANRGCLLMNLSNELSGKSNQISECVRNEFEQWIDLLSPTIEEAQRDGDINDSLAAKHVARLLYYQLYGGFTEMKALRSTNRMQQQLQNIFRLLKT